MNWFNKQLMKWKNKRQARLSGYLEEPPNDYDEYKVSGASSLPEAVDLRSELPPVRDQKYTQACTGFVVASLLEHMMYSKRGLHVSISPLFSWYIGKWYHNWAGQNKGVFFKYTMDGLFDYGFVYEKNMPFKPNYLRIPDDEDWAVAETSKFFLKFARKEQMTSWEIRDALSRGLLVAASIPLNKSFYGNTNGVIKDETPSKDYHMVTIVGYSDANSTYLIRNSWGKEWGDGGYCRVPYDYVNDHSCNLYTLNYK